MFSQEEIYCGMHKKNQKNSTMEACMKTPNPFPYSDSNKRYHTYDYAMRQRFGGKIARICLDAGMSCPNIDGTKGRGGCIYCSPAGSGDFAGDKALPIASQLQAGMGQAVEKWPAKGYIAYFQAHTNTYAPVKRLEALFRAAMAADGVVGLAIATRPDCLPEDVCRLLGDLSQETYLTVELGLQSIHDQTGQRINRCHTQKEFLAGYEKLASRKIATGVHLINGLPGETPEMMVESAQLVGKLRPHLLKIHLLYVTQDTVLAEWYRQGKFQTMEKEPFIQVICDQLEVLPEETIVGRLTGDGAPDTLIAPLWSRKKLCVLNEVDKEFVRRGSCQGRLFGK